MPYSAEDKKEIAEFEEEQKKEWNRVLIQHTRKVRAIKQPSPQFPETIKNACEKYFDLCEEDGVKPSVAGLSVALHTNREILLSWVRGEVSVESADVIREYFALLEVFDETALKDNRTNAVAGLFNMKNNYGYKDQVEHKIVDDHEISDEEIERRYRLKHEIVSDNPVAEIDMQPAKVSKSKKKNEKVIDDDISVPF